MRNVFLWVLMPRQRCDLKIDLLPMHIASFNLDLYRFVDIEEGFFLLRTADISADREIGMVHWYLYIYK